MPNIMDFCPSGLSVIEKEARAIFELTQQINDAFNEACRLLLATEGRIVVTGMGKSGHIGNKIAATLSSTGSPAFFMHPAEASHGDLGMVTNKDTVIAISNSGNTAEVLALLPQIKRLGIPMIALTGNTASTLAKMSDVHIDLTVEKEACPLNLAPTTSTTLALVMGDAIAIALLEARGFNADDFSRSHPGGTLGKRSFVRVETLSNTHTIPTVNADTPVKQALSEITEKKLGMTCVVDEKGAFVGIYTDGDIRRSLMQNQDILKAPISEVMTKGGKTIHDQALATEALALMQKHSITALVVTDNEQVPTGILHIHDLLRAGII